MCVIRVTNRALSHRPMDAITPSIAKQRQSSLVTALESDSLKIRFLSRTRLSWVQPAGWRSKPSAEETSIRTPGPGAPFSAPSYLASEVAR